jgi:hypothetical protein
MMKFTVEETNLLCIYHADTRAGTRDALRTALPFIDERDMQAIADSAAAKLDGMTDAEFAVTVFEPVHPVLFAEDEHGGG